MQQFTVRVLPSFLIFPISLLTVSNWANVKENKLFGRLSNMYLTMKLIFIDKVTIFCYQNLKYELSYLYNSL